MKGDPIIYYQNPDVFENEMGHLTSYTKTTGLY